MKTQTPQELQLKQQQQQTRRIKEHSHNRELPERQDQTHHNSHEGDFKKRFSKADQ